MDNARPTQELKAEITPPHCNDQQPRIIKIAKYHPHTMCGADVVGVNGIAPTVMEQHGNITAIIELSTNQRK